MKNLMTEIKEVQTFLLSEKQDKMDAFKDMLVSEIEDRISDACKSKKDGEQTAPHIKIKLDQRTDLSLDDMQEIIESSIFSELIEQGFNASIIDQQLRGKSESFEVNISWSW